MYGRRKKKHMDTGHAHISIDMDFVALGPLYMIDGM